jgi:hypothetical protein
MGCDYEEWINLSEDRDQGPVGGSCKNDMEVSDCKEGGEFLNQLTTALNKTVAFPKNISSRCLRIMFSRECLDCGDRN